MFNTENGCLKLSSGRMDYIRFGSGEKRMVMIPGLGDGLKTVRGMALPFSVMYRQFVKDFTVFVFSRRRELSPGMTIRDMADDLNEAMEALGLQESYVLGVSQGGMIAQYLAADHSDKVKKLILTVTAAKANDTMKEAVEGWIDMAGRGDYKGIMLDTAKRSYTEEKASKAEQSFGLLASLAKPRSFDRFIIQARSCLTHDAFSLLPEITAPTLIIGGTDDRIVTEEASWELAENIPGSRLFVYQGLGHGLYEEAKDFQERVRDFFLD